MIGWVFSSHGPGQPGAASVACATPRRRRAAQSRRRRCRRISKVVCRPSRPTTRPASTAGTEMRQVRDDVEGGHDRRAMLRRDHRDERAEAAEERDAEAGAAEDRAGEVCGARVASPQQRRSAPCPRRARSSLRSRRSTVRSAPSSSCDSRSRPGERDDADARHDHVRRAEQLRRELRGRARRTGCRSTRRRPPRGRPARTRGGPRRGTVGRSNVRRNRPALRHRLRHPVDAGEGDREQAEAGRDTEGRAARCRAGRATRTRARRARCRSPPQTPFARPTAAGSRRGCRSSSAALAALSAAPVARPWSPRATNSQVTESANAKATVDAISTPSATSSTGRRPTSSETRPASEQGREHAERVGRVDQRQRQRREVPPLRVDVIERRRRQRREQPEADHRLRPARRRARFGSVGRFDMVVSSSISCFIKLTSAVCQR